MAYHLFKSNAPYPKSKRSDILPRRLFMVPLIAAAVLGGSQPAANALFDPRGPDAWCAEQAVSDPFCQVSSIFSDNVYKLPELGESFVFISGGQFVMGTEGAQLTGDIIGGSPAVQFSTTLVLTGAMPADPFTVEVGLRDPCCDALCIASWTQFTGISGELVGLPGSIFDGARYAITKRSNDAQFGLGANTHNRLLGLFSKINFELINPLEHPTLPVGPFAGEVSATLGPEGVTLFVGANPQCFPPPVPDLAGTWTGTIDCVGFDAEASPDATPVEDFFSAAVLQIGRSTNNLDAGDEYSVRLTREAGNAQSFCAYAPSNPGSTTGGQGVLVDPQRHRTLVYFKFEADTLKARELIADGLNGTQLCKWNLTRTSTTPPGVADACSPSLCYLNGPSDQCHDDAFCGRGPGCNPSIDSCTCPLGFAGDGEGELGCLPAP